MSSHVLRNPRNRRGRRSDARPQVSSNQRLSNQNHALRRRLFLRTLSFNLGTKFQARQEKTAWHKSLVGSSDSHPVILCQGGRTETVLATVDQDSWRTTDIARHQAQRSADCCLFDPGNGTVPVSPAELSSMKRSSFCITRLVIALWNHSSRGERPQQMHCGCRRVARGQEAS